MHNINKIGIFITVILVMLYNIGYYSIWIIVIAPFPKSSHTTPMARLLFISRRCRTSTRRDLCLFGSINTCCYVYGVIWYIFSKRAYCRSRVFTYSRFFFDYIVAMCNYLFTYTTYSTVCYKLIHTWIQILSHQIVHCVPMLYTCRLCVQRSKIKIIFFYTTAAW